MTAGINQDQQWMMSVGSNMGKSKLWQKKRRKCRQDYWWIQWRTSIWSSCLNTPTSIIFTVLHTSATASHLESVTHHVIPQRDAEIVCIHSHTITEHRLSSVDQEHKNDPASQIALKKEIECFQEELGESLSFCSVFMTSGSNMLFLQELNVHDWISKQPTSSCQQPKTTNLFYNEINSDKWLKCDINQHYLCFF